jgi:chitin synthase
MAISIPEKDPDPLVKQAALFARTMKSVIESVEYLEVKKRNKPWGGGNWKKILVGIVSDGSVNSVTLRVLKEMGIYPSPNIGRGGGQNPLLNDGKSCIKDVNGELVRACLYEVCHSLPNSTSKPDSCIQYTTQFTLHFDNLLIDVVRGSIPVQVVLCLQDKDHAVPSHSWIKAFGEFLNLRICVAIEAGTRVDAESIYKMWDVPDGSGNVDGVRIVPYKDNFRSPKRFLGGSEAWACRGLAKVLAIIKAKTKRRKLD